MKKIYFLILMVISCLSSFTSLASPEEPSDIERNAVEIDTLYALDRELIPTQKVLELSRAITKNKDLYSNNTRAKLFSLLADTAINEGDDVRALQFAQDGESIVSIDQTLRLSLLLKIASGHYFQGKYHQAKMVASQAVSLAMQLNMARPLIIALSYRAMTNALIADNQLAVVDLKQVKRLLTEHQEFNDQIALLEVLANAHYYLGSYQTAISLYNKTLKIRFSMDKKQNIEQTYYNLARCYLKLGLLDDAYNAFWEAKSYAEKKQAAIRIAYAKLGLGQVLLFQQNLELSYTLLKEAKDDFNGQNLLQPYLTALLHLIKVTNAKGNLAESELYLRKAESLAQNTELTEEQIEFYLLLSGMYQQKEQYKKAVVAQNQYLELLRRFSHSHDVIVDDLDADDVASVQNREISLNMAEETDLKNQFEKRFKLQSNVIKALVTVFILSLILVLILAYRIRAMRLNQAYDEIEKPVDFVATPSQTKRFYQQHYKMARKHNYPLAVGYFAIDNWQELEFQFSKKVTNEVARTIATLVNQYRGEFDLVGVINEGEYLFLSPHQEVPYLKRIFEQLTSALKVQFFANLGEFSVKISYDCQAPSIQDIDPYIFLSRLSESTRAEYSSYKK